MRRAAVRTYLRVSVARHLTRHDATDTVAGTTATNVRPGCVPENSVVGSARRRDGGRRVATVNVVFVGSRTGRMERRASRCSAAVAASTTMAVARVRAKEALKRYAGGQSDREELRSTLCYEQSRRPRRRYGSAKKELAAAADRENKRNRVTVAPIRTKDT